MPTCRRSHVPGGSFFFTHALLRGQEFHARELKLGGLEKHWIAYVHLIEAACNGDSLDPPLAEIDTLFARRNKDKRIIDWYQIEGSGVQPVKWDFRRHSLLNYINRASENSSGVSGFSLPDVGTIRSTTGLREEP